MTKQDKRDRAELFRTRLAQAMGEAGTNQSALARSIGVDRSTISQLLTGDGARLPNAQVVGECAMELGVSSDWLLGLSERPENAADLMAINLTMTEAPRALVDQQIFDWHKEAIGYKIRHVPAALPDMLKTREMLEWEYRPHLGRTTDQAIGASEDKLEFMRQSRSDFEIAVPRHEVECLARGEGYYAGLSTLLRRAQLRQMLELYRQLYPTLRVYLFDARRVFSAPVTVFGPLLAVLYVGRNYIAFRDSERVQTFSRHFDGLVKEAEVSDREIEGYLEGLLGDVG
ncbi:MAG: helix-turn-helix transcriptional regulator [Rhodobacter sp.]|nr:helix-turn-helix transcriptional regulator [Rhodobacter sp.]